MGKNIAKDISKSFSRKYSQKLLDLAKQSATDALKTASKRTIQKTTKASVIWLEIKLSIELGKCQKLHHRIFQLQMKKKYWNW